MKEVLWFETTQCFVRVYDTNEEYCRERLYVVSSHHKNNGKDNIRFATFRQLGNMIGQYRNNVIGYKCDYERYMAKFDTYKKLWNL